ncbi:DUF1467 family protein [Maritimibacter sp. UBA3975]|uniref:DUF1467 family protein n=1 Tax=Maritimibacter sp. UBA3975 TaxID=1946833 RepID=UPI000C0B6F24|nr:DUF1467 family protein [Maritimibacter sp. UBA3975]MAM63905.1 hypothetical protein [Maritimibacter sp.]|tara:strand:+ start:37017 stop:37298 length:282 start_codon:yes stop_codon:yes gene_type:complete
MSVTGAAVLFVVIWFMTMFIVLPIQLRTQAEDGDVVPGTHEGAPSDFRLGRTMLVTTLWALPIWAVCAGIIISGVITVDMLDWQGYLGERVPN